MKDDPAAYAEEGDEQPTPPLDVAAIMARHGNPDAHYKCWCQSSIGQVQWPCDAYRLAAELAKERELREAFEGAAADLAQAGVAERDALRKVIAIQEKARAA